MKISNDLRQLAAEAFSTGILWPEFLAEHRDAIRAAEPYSRGRYRRLIELVRSVVVSGSSSGLFAAGDDDASAEWFGDDAPEQQVLFDVAEAYR